MAQVPIPIPRGRQGSEKVPDYVQGAPASKSRGKYPKDAGGPPQTAVGRGGPSGDKFEITAVPTVVERPLPKSSPEADTSNPIK